jgi:predicted nucleotidyltransferase
MDNIKNEISQLKRLKNVSKAYLFGSANSKSKPNDIDLLLFGDFNKLNENDLKVRLSLPIKRIQLNCYKRTDVIDSDELSYDIVLVNNKKVLNYFIQRNKKEMIEL